MSQQSATSNSAPGEAANVSLVEKFFADWAKRDAHVLAKYLADDFAYQMIEGEPDIIGPDQFVATLKDVLPGFVTVDMHIRRITGYGHLVMVERFDQMTGVDEAHSMNFEVVAVLMVQDGKIQALRDYPIPGGVFDLGSAWLEGTDADAARLEAAARFES